MLILAILVFGMFAGWAAQLLLARGRPSAGVDWGQALVAGLVGSFVGGLVLSLLAGDGLQLRPSGMLGSISGALVTTALWTRLRARRAA